MIRTWIGTERGADGKTKVSFVWEPVPRAPGDTARSSGTPARVAITAVSPEGSPYFRGRVPDQAASPSRVSFDVAPGKVQLRLSVESADGQVLDSEVREITVPDLTSQLVVGTPEVFHVRTVRDLQQLKADPQALPAVSREFNRTERLLIRLTAYGPAGTTPKLTARLLNRAGQTMSELPVAAAASSAIAFGDRARARPDTRRRVRRRNHGERRDRRSQRAGCLPCDGLMLALLLLALALATGPGAEPADAADLIEPVVVRIDAVPSDASGRFVENLVAEDFEVLEAGAPRPIESVRVRPPRGKRSVRRWPHRFESRADEHAAAALDGARVFAVFLDEYHITPGPSADRARQALVRFVNEALGPRDLVVLVKPLDSLLSLRLTRDHKGLVRTIETFEGREGRVRSAQRVRAGTHRRHSAED